MQLPTRKVKLDIQSGDLYTAGGTCKIKLSQLAAVSKPGTDGRNTVVIAIVIGTALTVNNASGSTINLEHEKAHDVVRRFQLISNDHSKFSFPQRGGLALREIYRRVTGRNPLWRSDTSILNAANGTIRPYFVLPFFDEAAERPDDFNEPARAFKDSEIEFDWANGAAGSDLFGAGVSITAGAGVGVTEAFAIVADVDHFTVPTKRTWMQRVLKSLTDSETLPAGFKWLDILLMPHHSPSGGVATSPYTTTTITKIELNEDGEQIVKNCKPDSLVASFNMDLAGFLEQAAELAIYEANGDNILVPIKNIQYKQNMTSGLVCTGNPKIDITGTITPANNSLVACGIQPTVPAYAMTVFKGAGHNPSAEHAANPDGFWKERTSNKQLSLAEHKRVWLPQTLVPGGRKGDVHRARRAKAA